MSDKFPYYLVARSFHIIAQKMLTVSVGNIT